MTLFPFYIDWRDDIEDCNRYTKIKYMNMYFDNITVLSIFQQVNGHSDGIKFSKHKMRSLGKAVQLLCNSDPDMFYYRNICKILLFQNSL